MEEIKISKVVRRFLDNKKLFVVNSLVVFVLACAFILCIPRTYHSEIRLAPETEISSGLNSLSSLAATFGVDIGGMNSSDAISPDLYPDLFKSQDFIVKLLGIKVYSEKAGREIDYYTYLTDYLDSPPWAPIFRTVINLFKRKKKPIQLPDIVGNAEGQKGINSFLLSEKEYMAVQAVKSNIKCSQDKKTGIINIKVVDQNPLICACLADSARLYLQEFITSYRTNKARVDVDYYRSLCQKAKEDYDKSVVEYGAFADSHVGQVRQSYQTKMDELESEVQFNLTTLVSFKQQLLSAEAKVQERTPAFTILESASVPNKASGPKRVIFVAFMLILSFIGTYLWLIRDGIKDMLGLNVNKE